MKRAEALEAIKDLVGDPLVVTTAGGATGEWHAIHPSDANLQVKTLGLCSSIGMGLSQARHRDHYLLRLRPRQP